MNRMPQFKLLAALLSLLFSLSGCIGRELDDNDTFQQAQPSEMDADNALLLSKIFVIDESNTYLWFDLHNEVANFSQPELLLPTDNGGTEGTLRIPLRGLLYEYRANEHTLTFKRVPPRFLNWGETTASFVFNLTQTDGGSILLPGGKTQKGSKPTFELALKSILIDGAQAPIAVGTPFNADGRSIKMKPYTKKLTLING